MDKWVDINLTPPPSSVDIMLGRYDNDQNYTGWVWITKGMFEDGVFYCDFLDDDLELSYYRTPTHWYSVPSSPENIN